jgi:putative FmdB family regulatory protein
MPTYDYACAACKHAFEQYQSIIDAPLRKCPACGKHRLQRLIGTGGGIIFKGSGFYQTDYRSESYKKAAAADTGATGSSTGSKTESPAKGAEKPAATSDKPKKPAPAAS